MKINLLKLDRYASRRLRRVCKLLLLPMVVILPVWLTLGRAALGSIGWLTVLLVFTVIPVVFVLSLIQAIVLLRQAPVRESGLIGRRDAVLVTVFYVAASLAGLCMVDFGDMEGSIGSVASRLLGNWFVVPSTILSVILALVATTALLTGLVNAIIGLIRAKAEMALAPIVAPPMARSDDARAPRRRVENLKR